MLADAYETTIALDAPRHAYCPPIRVASGASSATCSPTRSSTAEGRDVIVTVAANASAVAVAVRDFGVGFSAAQSHQVFSLVLARAPSRQRTVGGSGLGLLDRTSGRPTARRMAERMGRPGRRRPVPAHAARAAGESVLESPIPVVPEGGQ